MPINPNTRYYVEAQTLQIAYNKCTDMMQKCVSSMKRILISSIITGVLTMILWIASIIICGFSLNHAVFLITFLTEVGLMIEYGRDSRNIAINPDMNENVQNILYGDKYAISEVNPEELHNITNKLTLNTGVMQSYIKGFNVIHIMMELICITNSALFFARIIIHFIG